MHASLHVKKNYGHLPKMKDLGGFSSPTSFFARPLSCMLAELLFSSLECFLSKHTIRATAIFHKSPESPSSPAIMKPLLETQASIEVFESQGRNQRLSIYLLISNLMTATIATVLWNVFTSPTHGLNDAYKAVSSYCMCSPGETTLLPSLTLLSSSV